MKGLALLASLFICFQLSACQFQSDDVRNMQGSVGEAAITENKTLTGITLANGQIIFNCAQYNHARSVYSIMETVNNNIIASEYLPCSLPNTSPIQADEADKLAKLLLALSVRQLPLSIAPQYGRKTLLSEAGFSQAKDKLLWSAEQHSVVLQVKAKSRIFARRYLIWVSDVIADGNYHAYYPAWIDTSDNSSTIRVLPVYHSGF